MFTPDQERAAAEMIRVCKPCGKIGMANWTPDGFIGQLFKTIGKHLPPPAGVRSQRSGARRSASASCSAPRLPRSRLSAAPSPSDKATTYVDMNDESLVGFDAIEEATPTLWSFHTATGNDLDLQGQGLTYDAQWHALTGIVTTIAIDVGNNDVLNPDVLITGINVGAPTLDDGADSFWRFLEGNDTFILPTAPSAGTGFSIFGDVSTARPGAASGGNDVIHAKGATAYIAGDAFHVGTEEADAPTARYQGGADQIHGRATNAQQFLVGDAAQVVALGTLTGGNDNIFIQTTYGGSFAIGDADVVYGGNGDRTEVVGGNDYIAAGTGSRADPDRRRDDPERLQPRPRRHRRNRRSRAG